MTQWWTIAKSLEGKTLHTPSQKVPFKVIDVSEDGLKIRRRTGKDQPISRKLIEAGCRYRLDGGEVRGTGLYEAGIVRSKTHRSYLPAIILAITDESEHST